MEKSKVYLLIVCIMSFILFVDSAKADGATCVYKDSNYKVTFISDLDKDFEFKFSGPSVASGHNDTVKTTDFINEEKQFFCPNEIKYKMTSSSSRQVNLYFSFSSDSEYNLTLKLDEEKSSVQNTPQNSGGDETSPGDDGNSLTPSTTIVRTCEYNYVTVNYLSNQTIRVESTNHDSEKITEGSGLKDAFKNSCPEEIYVADARGYLAVYSSYVMGTTKLSLYIPESETEENTDTENTDTEDDKGMSCDFLWGDPDDPNDPAYWVQWALDLIKYLAIIALLLLSTIDFVKAFISQDRDAINHALTTSAKRAIFAVMIFFLPILVELIMTLFGAYGTCGFE